MQKGPQRELRFTQSVDSMLKSLQQNERHAGSIGNANGEGMYTSSADKRSQYVGHLEEKVMRTLKKEDQIDEAVIESFCQT